MKSNKLYGIIVLAAAIALLMAACDDTPGLSGTINIDNTEPVVGETLTATYSDGNGTGVQTWQWLRDNNVITGATNRAYTVVAADEGFPLRVETTFSHQKGRVYSDNTDIVTVDSRPALSGRVTIVNTSDDTGVGRSPEVGDHLIAYFEFTGRVPTSGAANWQWLRGTTVIASGSNVYVVKPEDSQGRLRARVSYPSHRGTRSSERTEIVEDRRFELPYGTFYINITRPNSTIPIYIPEVGDTLYAVIDDGTNNWGTPSWRWFRDSHNISSLIATNTDTYTVTSADIGRRITVEVRFSGRQGFDIRSTEPVIDP